MAFRRLVPGPGGSRFAAAPRLGAAALLALFILLAGSSGAGAVGGSRSDTGLLGNLQQVDADRDVLRLTRLIQVPRKEVVADPARDRDEPATSVVERGLAWGRATLDRYGAERILLAVVVGALVQVACLLVLRLVGSVVRLATRVLAGGIGVVVALSLLDGSGWRPSWTDEALVWFDRLVDLTRSIA